MSRKKYAIPFAVAATTLLLAACNGGGEVETETVVVDAAMDGTAAVYSAGGGASSYDAIDEARSSTVEGGTGVFDYTGLTFDEKTQALGKLEEYAVDNALTGIPLYQTDGYQMFNSRVTKGTDTYVVGYGFDTLRSGSLNTSIDVGEDSYNTYYHTWNANNPNSLAYWDDSGSEVSSLNSYVATSYFGTRLNAEKDGYEWYGVLSKDNRPWGVFYEDDGETVKEVTKADELELNELTDTWRVYIRDDIKYRIASTRDDRKEYDGRTAVLEDYVTAFKVLLNGKYGYYRGNETASSTGASAIVGASDYYTATANCNPWDAAATEAWEDVGVKSGKDDHGEYIQIQIGAPVNRFYGMYYITSTFYQPLPMDFFRRVTKDGAEFDNWGKNSSDLSTKIIDNILCLGPMYLESWDDTAIIYKTNDEWWEKKENPDLYSIAGVHMAIMTAYNTDNTAPFREFINGNLDTAGIPQSYIEQYRNDGRTVKVPGDSVFKLNVNSCDQELWNELFGDNGSVSAQGDNAWECKPWMSNDDFVKGLFYSIDRKTFAESRGYAPSINYFSDDYLSNPEEGVSYNSTTEHTNAQADFWGSTTSTNGYSVQVAGERFTSAINALIAAGSVKDGDTLTIDSWWMYESQSAQAEEIATYMEKAFNESDGAKQHNLTLDVVNSYVTVWSDVYYGHLLIGMFDLGFGSISGNSLDPLNFMEVLKSNNSSGFTLNWGSDTSEFGGIEFNGEKWSFDGLWAATDHGIATYKGVELPPFALEATGAETDENGACTLSFEFEDAASHLEGMNESAATTLAKAVREQYDISIDDVYLTDNFNFGAAYAGPGYVAAYPTLKLGDYLGQGSAPTGMSVSNFIASSDGGSGVFDVTFSKDVMIAAAQAQIDNGYSPFLSVYLEGSATLSSSTSVYVDYDFTVIPTVEERPVTEAAA